jgi:hypothetical protein
MHPRARQRLASIGRVGKILRAKKAQRHEIAAVDRCCCGHPPPSWGSRRGSAVRFGRGSTLFSCASRPTTASPAEASVRLHRQRRNEDADPVSHRAALHRAERGDSGADERATGRRQFLSALPVYQTSTSADGSLPAVFADRPRIGRPSRPRLRRRAPRHLMGAGDRVQHLLTEVVEDAVRGRGALHIGHPHAVLEIEEDRRDDAIGRAQHHRAASSPSRRPRFADRDRAPSDSRAAAPAPFQPIRSPHPSPSRRRFPALRARAPARRRAVERQGHKPPAIPRQSIATVRRGSRADRRCDAGLQVEIELGEACPRRPPAASARSQGDNQD